MTIQSLTDFIEQFFSCVKVEMLVYGNITQDQAVGLANCVEETLQVKTKPLVNCERTLLRQVKLPSGSEYLYQHRHEVSKMSALKVYYESGTEDTHANMLLELFSAIIEEPCYDILRAQQELGYTVYANEWRTTSGVRGITIDIQSDKHPEYLHKKVDEFIEQMGSYIENMSLDVFQGYVNSLASERQDNKTLVSQHHQYMYEISIKQYNFDRDAIEVSHLQTLTKQDIIDFYKQHIAPKAPEQRKLAIYILGKDEPAAEVTLKKSIHEIRDTSELKQTLGFHPLPEPYINVASEACAQGQR